MFFNIIFSKFFFINQNTNNTLNYIFDLSPKYFAFIQLKHVYKLIDYNVDTALELVSRHAL